MISIIIPTLNEEKVIGLTVAGLKSKFSIPHEIIVSDGKSTDRTVETARLAGATVVAYSGTTRQTIAQGRNDGARIAKGEFLVFLDADCSIKDPEKFFQVALKNFADPKLTGLVPWIKVLPEMATWADRLVYAVFNSYLWLINNLLGLGVSGGEFQMMRQSDFQKIGGYNETLVASEDMELLGRLSKLGKVKLDRKLVVYHTGRRAHKVGWPKLLRLWMANSISMMTRKRAYSKEWTVIR